MKDRTASRMPVSVKREDQYMLHPCNFMNWEGIEGGYESKPYHQPFSQFDETGPTCTLNSINDFIKGYL
jgi:hypothetical protein